MTQKKFWEILESINGWRRCDMSIRRRPRGTTAAVCPICAVLNKIKKKTVSYTDAWTANKELKLNPIFVEDIVAAADWEMSYQYGDKRKKYRKRLENLCKK